MSNAGTVLYSCPFVPAEWIDAYGFKPRRAAPPPSEPGAPVTHLAGMCPYARAFANLAGTSSDIRAVIVTTACDQMRHCAELIEPTSQTPIFVFNLPHTWRQPAAVKLYQAELTRLGAFLASLGGMQPSRDRLIGSIQAFDRGRKTLRDVRGLVKARAWAELAADFHATGAVPTFASTQLKPTGPAVALVGGPLPREHFVVFDLIDEAGAHVELDATETGERTLAAPIKLRLLEEDPITAITEAYFGAIPDPFRRPNSAFFQWMRSEVDKRGIRGVIVRRYLWCDVWHAEVRRLGDWLGVPVLDMDATDEGSDLQRARTRLGAFVEGLA
jgi:benzoyl-CoA reductase/2-hydroxyglutaryl-CoA dehydratase subunit BcrC/BadD/HgdB